MKIGIAFLPLSFPISPYMSVPLLAGQLKQAGFNVDCIDLNAEFYFDICKKEVLKSSIKKIENEIITLKDVFSNSNASDFEIKTIDEKISYFKYLYIKSEFIKNKKLYNDVVRNISSSISILKSKKDFYNPNKFKNALMTVHNAVDLFFLSYSPAVSKNLKIKKTIFDNTFKDIKYQTYCERVNPYIEYFKEKLKNGSFDKYSVLYISIPFSEQLIPALTLARLLKESKNIKIVIGGNYITRVKAELIKYPELFDLYVDAILPYDGEVSVVEYAKYLNSKMLISDVSGLIWRNEYGSIVENKVQIYENIENRAVQCFDELDFSKYLVPEIEISVQASKGCYWNKCTFCDYSYGKPVYSICSADKLVDEFSYYKEKYNVSLFEITDEALDINFFEKVADKLIEKNLNIKLYCFLRLESFLTKELLEKFYNAGVVCVQWGYEATSERIMKLMNKGIDVAKRLDILKMSSDVGIWNRVFGLACFPSETEEELLETIKTFGENRNIIHSFVIYKFVMGKYSYINNNLDKFNLEKIPDNERISAINSFNASNYTENVKKAYEYIKQEKHNNFWLDIFPDEYLLYYLAYYTKDNLYSLVYKR